MVHSLIQNAYSAMNLSHGKHSSSSWLHKAQFQEKKLKINTSCGLKYPLTINAFYVIVLTLKISYLNSIYANKLNLGPIPKKWTKKSGTIAHLNQRGIIGSKLYARNSVM